MIVPSRLWKSIGVSPIVSLGYDVHTHTGQIEVFHEHSGPMLLACGPPNVMQKASIERYAA